MVNKANFEAYIRDLLLSRLYRVEVYTGGAKTNNWILDYKVIFWKYWRALKSTRYKVPRVPFTQNSNVTGITWKP